MLEKAEEIKIRFRLELSVVFMIHHFPIHQLYDSSLMRQVIVFDICLSHFHSLN